MFLSRLMLNPRSRQVRREVGDPYQTHRTIMQAFPRDLPDRERVLFRLDDLDAEGSLTLLVQSQTPPDWSYLSGKDYLLETFDGANPAVKAFVVSFKAGQHYRFRLRANPTVKKDRPGKEQGRRLPILREEDQLAWLARKMETCGAELRDARVIREGKNAALVHRTDQIHKASLWAVRFEGVLQVKHPEMLEQAVRSGIGSAKGLGFGLLSLAHLK